MDQMGLKRREVLVAALMAVALVGIAAADYKEKPEFYKAPAYVAKPKDLSLEIQVQGGILCRDNGKLSPLEGAMARLTCIAMRGKGAYESAPFSVVSKATDAKGYFKINLSKYDVGPYKLTACKVFLETPPPGECGFPTDVNHGLAGAPLPPTYRLLSDQTRLYSIPPFVYTNPTY
ncbi:hypothetical protein V2J09_021967 [Rumex salicifolius]